MSNRINISDVAFGALRAPFANSAAAGRLALQAALPFAAVLGVSSYALQQILAGLPVPMTGGLQPATMLKLTATMMAPILFTLLLMLPVATSWHRLILLGEQPRGFLLRLDRHVWSYTRFKLLLCMTVLVVMSPAIAVLCAQAAPGRTGLGSTHVPPNVLILAFALMLVAFFIAIRLSIGLPARAIGRQIGLWDAADLSRGNAGYLFCAALIVGLPVSMAQHLLTKVGLSQLAMSPVAVTAVQHCILFVISMLSTMSNSSLLALAYRQLTTAAPSDPASELDGGATALPA